MIKKIVKSIREYKKDTILTPIFVALEVVFEILITYNMAQLIDKGVEVGNTEMIIKIGLILIFMAICSLILGALSGISCAKASSGFAKNLRKDIFYKIQNLSFSNIDKFKTSGLVTRLTTDVMHVSWAFQTIIRIAVRAPLTIIFALIMITQINAKIALIFLGIIPFMLIGLLLIIKFSHPLFRKTFDEYDRMNNVVSENLNGIRVVKSFVAEDKEIKKFNHVSNRIYRLYTKAQNILSFNNPLMQLCVYTTMLLIAWIGAKLIVTGSLTTGQLMSLFTYIMQVLGSLMMISMVFVSIVVSRESVERVCEVLDEKIDLESNPNGIKDVMNGEIIFDNVDFSYVKNKNKLCLSSVNLKIESGEMIGIIGSTGSSKSTLVQLISRLYDVTNGQILVGGHNVKDYDLTSLRDQVGMVLQKNVLFSGTIRENLKWGNANASDEQLDEVCEIACCKDFIMNFKDKYDTYIEQGGTNVSGGQKQRLCLARALLKRPKILILDDSTSAVDTKTDNSIKIGLRRYLPDSTKLIIAQRINSIIDCDRIIVMNEGRVDAFGTHDELLKNNKIYQEVYYSQEGGVNNE